MLVYARECVLRLLFKRGPFLVAELGDEWSKTCYIGNRIEEHGSASSFTFLDTRVILLHIYDHDWRSLRHTWQQYKYELNNQASIGHLIRFLVSEL